MRGWKTTLGLVVVLGGLFAYIYFVTWKQPEGGDAASKQEKVFAGLETDKVDDIKVKSEKGDTTTVKKENGAWQSVAGLRRWESDATWRPLARRDAVRGPVYDRYYSINRHQSFPNGWIQWQDNVKMGEFDGKLQPLMETVTGYLDMRLANVR